MASTTLYGFLGVVLGGALTSGVAIYREHFLARAQARARADEEQSRRGTKRKVFQRENMLALQAAAADLIRAAYSELDRLLEVRERTGRWSERHWETPTAVGWSDALLRLETSRARVFDDELRRLADELRVVTADSVWAPDLAGARQNSERIEPLLRELNSRVTEVLPDLY